MSDSPRLDNFDPRLEAYLDGLMSEAERAAFEHDMGGAAAIQHEAELQSRIDDGLRQLFAYEPPVALASSITEQFDPGNEPNDLPELIPMRSWLTQPQFRKLALAACLLLAAGAFFVVTNKMMTPPEKFITPEFVYRTVEKPEFVCTTDAEFAAAIEKRFGEPLVLAAAPSEQIVAEGWAYGDGNTYDGKIRSWYSAEKLAATVVIVATLGLFVVNVAGWGLLEVLLNEMPKEQKRIDALGGLLKLVSLATFVVLVVVGAVLGSRASHLRRKVGIEWPRRR